MRLAFIAALAAFMLIPAGSASAVGPVLDVIAKGYPTQVAPGEVVTYVAQIENLGSDPTSGDVNVTATLPEGMTVTGIRDSGFYWTCPGFMGATTVTCTLDVVDINLSPDLGPHAWTLYPLYIEASVDADAPAGPREAHFEVSGGGAQNDFASATNRVSSDPAGYGIDQFSGRFVNGDGSLARQAGGHPDFTTYFTINSRFGLSGAVGPTDNIKDVEVELPPGLVGDPSAIPTCTAANLVGPATQPLCAPESQVGLAFTVQGTSTFSNPVYNVVAPAGSPGRFAFNINGVIINLDPHVRSNGDYGITARVANASQSLPVMSNRVTLWGVPADPANTPQRQFLGQSLFYGAPSTAPRVPFLTMPTRCPNQVHLFRVSATSWGQPSVAHTASFDSDINGNPITTEGCNQLDFSPTIEARPTTNLADSPAGLDVNLHIPQNEDPDGFAEAHLKDATITLPPGMTVNPSSAQGLSACSPAQVGLASPVGQAAAQFDEVPVTCPDSSKLGTVQVDTPVLDHPLKGSIYLASQNENPFGSLLALYIVVEDVVSGVTIKLAGQPQPDPQTGQLTVGFKQNPQLPFEDLRVSLFTGPRASLKTPISCGNHTTTSSLIPWSSPEGATATPADTFAITQGAGGGACLRSEAEAPNSPSFAAGTVDPAAGAYTPFVLKLARADGTQTIKAIDTTLPKGLLGKLAGIAYCSDGALAAAAGRSGKAEQASASCPGASRVGSVNVGAGAGSNPLYVDGEAYLAGPYKGAPLSLAVITPAVAGPFDLGTVVIRNALNVDPETAQIHAVSDPLPTILQGIPLDIRSIALRMDRPSFTLNPTSCDPMSVLAGVTSVFNQTASLSNRFQVGGCNALTFKPKLAIDLKGGTKRSKYPALKATLTARPGDANIGRAQVTLPKSQFLEQSHIRTICTRVQYAANACPPASVYGKATAWSPLLDQPLSGPVYLRSSSNPLPDLVAKLDGQIHIDLVGRIDSVKERLRSTFESVPDAPVSKFVLEMEGGKKGLLVNNRDLCRSTNKADVQLDGQNGTAADSTPVVTNDCKKKQRKGKKAGKNRGGKPTRKG
ncbi:MAG TPA: hypothetical protein VFX85_08905 [Solirubrobacterales bacterium]|nr:hypothetical protein [Solirubrobacterales bacterium]